MNQALFFASKNRLCKISDIFIIFFIRILFSLHQDENPGNNQRQRYEIFPGQVKYPGDKMGIVKRFIQGHQGPEYDQDNPDDYFGAATG